jgi:hypothetical protein
MNLVGCNTCADYAPESAPETIGIVRYIGTFRHIDIIPTNKLRSIIGIIVTIGHSVVNMSDCNSCVIFDDFFDFSGTPLFVDCSDYDT